MFPNGCTRGGYCDGCGDRRALPAAGAAPFLAPLPVRALPGVGSKAESALRSLGISTVGQMRSIDASARVRFVSAVGSSASRLLRLAGGVDDDRVVQSGAPKSVTVCDSFVGCTSFEQLAAVLQVLQ
jgi:nucleotidyltransferase/DNA polymerase involved in DNA repair